jgi:hypothetical protein
MINLLFLLSIFFQSDYKHCSFGSFETGIISCEVIGAESGCCSEEPGKIGSIGFYENSGGAWKLVAMEEMSAGTAQNECCPNPNS